MTILDACNEILDVSQISLSESVFPHCSNSSLTPRQSICPSLAFSIDEQINLLSSGETHIWCCEEQLLSSPPFGQFHTRSQCVYSHCSHSVSFLLLINSGNRSTNPSQTYWKTMFVRISIRSNCSPSIDECIYSQPNKRKNSSSSPLSIDCYSQSLAMIFSSSISGQSEIVSRRQ